MIKRSSGYIKMKKWKGKMSSKQIKIVLRARWSQAILAIWSNNKWTRKPNGSFLCWRSLRDRWGMKKSCWDWKERRLNNRGEKLLKGSSKSQMVFKEKKVMWHLRQLIKLTTLLKRVSSKFNTRKIWLLWTVTKTFIPRGKNWTCQQNERMDRNSLMTTSPWIILPSLRTINRHFQVKRNLFLN